MVPLEFFAKFLDSESGADRKSAKVIGQRRARAVLRELFRRDKIRQAMIELVFRFIHLLAQEMESG